MTENMATNRGTISIGANKISAQLRVTTLSLCHALPDWVWIPGTGYYPFTLIFENEITARPDVGIPIDMAGRKVVKISMFFTFGNSD